MQIAAGVDDRPQVSRRLMVTGFAPATGKGNGAVCGVGVGRSAALTVADDDVRLLCFVNI